MFSVCEYFLWMNMFPIDSCAEFMVLAVGVGDGGIKRQSWIEGKGNIKGS